MEPAEEKLSSALFMVVETRLHVFPRVKIVQQAISNPDPDVGNFLFFFYFYFYFSIDLLLPWPEQQLSAPHMELVKR